MTSSRHSHFGGIQAKISIMPGAQSEATRPACITELKPLASRRMRVGKSVRRNSRSRTQPLRAREQLQCGPISIHCGLLLLAGLFDNRCAGSGGALSCARCCRRLSMAKVLPSAIAERGISAREQSPLLNDQMQYIYLSAFCTAFHRRVRRSRLPALGARRACAGPRRLP